MSELLDVEEFSELLNKITTRELLEKLTETVQRADPEHSHHLIEAIKNELYSMQDDQYQAEMELENAKKEEYRQKVLETIREVKEEHGDRVLHVVAEANEDYDDWYSSDEPEYYIEDPEGVIKLLKRLENILLEASWPDQWRLRLELLEEVLNLDLEIDDYYAGSFETIKDVIEEIEMLTDDGMSVSSVWNSIVASCLLNQQEDLDTRLADLFEKAVCYDLSLDIFTSPAVNEKLDAKIKLTIATKWFDLLASGEFGNLRDAVENGLKWIPDLELQKEYVLKLVRSIPYFRKNFFETYRQSASLESQSQFLEELLARMENEPYRRALWHDELSMVEQKRGNKEKAIDQLKKAINDRPTFKRYYALVCLDPDQDFLPDLKSINKDKYLSTTYSVLEGNIEPILNELTREAGQVSSRRTEMTVLLCLLGHSMTHKSLFALAERFLMEGNYASFESTALDEQKVDYSMIFSRAFERAQLSEEEIQKALDLLNDRILEFCEEITASQARKEYFRCAQFVGALYHARSLYGEKGLSDDFHARYDKLIKRYPRFRAEINDWL